MTAAAVAAGETSSQQPLLVRRQPSILAGSVDGKAPPPNPDDAGRPPCPLEHCPWWSALSFAWLNPLIKLGSRRVLEESDLPALSKAERAERLDDLVLVRTGGAVAAAAAAAAAVVVVVVVVVVGVVGLVVAML
jgi:hypothetical protein